LVGGVIRVVVACPVPELRGVAAAVLARPCCPLTQDTNVSTTSCVTFTLFAQVSSSTVSGAVLVSIELGIQIACPVPELHGVAARVHACPWSPVRQHSEVFWAFYTRLILAVLNLFSAWSFRVFRVTAIRVAAWLFIHHTCAGSTSVLWSTSRTLAPWTPC